MPPDVARQAWKGRYRGQTQKWYALRFTGDDSEIDIASRPAATSRNSSTWRWEPMRKLPDLMIPFKRAVYRSGGDAFAHLNKARRGCPAPDQA